MKCGHARLALFVSSVLPAAPLGAQRAQPELVGPGVISTSADELNFTLSKDGGEVYFTLNAPDSRFAAMMVSRRSGNGWSKPEVVPFSGRFNDYDPVFSPDGSRLFFISNRPREPSGTRPGDFDIFFVDRQGGGWSEPQRLPSPINSDQDEYYPSVASDGTLYFSANRAGGQGGFDLWRSRLQNGTYLAPENLGPAVNARGGEIDSWVAPDQSFIIFASYGRPDELGRGDLYISHFRDGAWMPAQNLGAPINSTAREYCPIGSPDGQWFYWTSKRGVFDEPPAQPLKRADVLQRLAEVLNGQGNIYRVPLEDLLRAGP